MTAPAHDIRDFSQSFAKACDDINAMMSGYISAAAKSSAAAWQGIDDLTRNAGGLVQESLARGVSVCQSLMSARSPQEAADTHAEFLKDSFDGLIAGGGKLSEISLRTAKGAIEPLSQHANDAMGAVIKKASVA